MRQTVLDRMTDADRPVAERLWQLYQHDLSEFRGSFPSPEGLFKAGRLPTFLSDPERCGYLVRSPSGPAGFVCVRGVHTEPRVMGEFFVVRAARRSGVGRSAAVDAMRRHPGRWEIPFQEENPGAAAFWRRVATDVVGSAWSEERRPVPDKPHVPPDVWLMLEVS
jgi:predicted acetyltransferase